MDINLKDRGMLEDYLCVDDSCRERLLLHTCRICIQDNVDPIARKLEAHQHHSISASARINTGGAI